jgi:hypothetical protein
MDKNTRPSEDLFEGIARRAIGSKCRFHKKMLDCLIPVSSTSRIGNQQPVIAKATPGTDAEQAYDQELYPQSHPPDITPLHTPENTPDAYLPTHLV